MKIARLRPRAELDLLEAAGYYAGKGGRGLAESMFDAALAALEPIQRMPSMGSLRLGQMCAIPGLRSWRVKGFPMLWFYFERDAYLDLVRLLGDRQDITTLLAGDDAPT